MCHFTQILNYFLSERILNTFLVGPKIFSKFKTMLILFPRFSLQFSAWYVLFALQFHYSLVPNFLRNGVEWAFYVRARIHHHPRGRWHAEGREIYRLAYKSSSNFLFMFSGTGNEKRRTLRKSKRKWGTKDVTFLAGDDFTRARVISSPLPPYGKKMRN